MSSAKVLMTVFCPHSKPSIERAAKMLGVTQESLDISFGVICVDPDHSLYAVRVSAGAVTTLQSSEPCSEPFSDPKIETFGFHRK
jgi:hypothetical protein